MAQKNHLFWKDTLCQNNLKLNYTPVPFTAYVQTPPIYDFIGITLIQVFTGIASSSNDSNLSFTRLVNEFGNLSILTSSPLIIRKSLNRKKVYYNDFFAKVSGTVPNQSGEIDE